MTANDRNLKQVSICMTDHDNKPFDAVTVNMSKLVIDLFIDLFIDSLTYALWDSLTANDETRNASQKLCAM